MQKNFKQYLPLTGGTLTGTLKFTRNNAGVTFGPGSNDRLYLQLTNSNVGSSYENYWFPTFDNDTDSGKAYYILTSKSPVTIAQGGTGAKTADDALANLGLSDSGWITLSLGTNVSSGNIYYRKIGKLVSVRVQRVRLASAIANSTALATLPLEYRPNANIYTSGLVQTSSEYNPIAYTITTDGNINVFRPVYLSSIDTTYYLSLTMSFLI